MKKKIVMKARNSDPAFKADFSKLRWDLMPVRAMEDVIKIYNYGAAKYGDDNWRKGMKWSRYYAAALRHLTAFWKGETYDKESGLPHVAHAAWSCLALLEYMRYLPQFDDRPSLQYKKKNKGG